MTGRSPIQLPSAPLGDTPSDLLQQAVSDSTDFQQIIDEAHDAVLVALADGRHVDANQKAVELTGYSKRELIQIRMPELAHPDELPIIKARLVKRLRGEPVPKTYMTRIRHKSGRTIHIELTGLKTTWEGQPADVVIFSDRTEVVEKTKALDQSNAHLRTMIDNTSDLICALTLEGRIKYANTALRQMFAATYGHQALEGCDIWAFFPESRRQFWQTIIADVLSHGESRFDQHYLINGRRYDIDWHCSRVLDPDKRPIGVTIFGRDITERLKAQEAFQESQAALFHARKFEALGTLCGGLAHEFNNFMSVILGNVEMAAEEADDPGKVCEYATGAKAAVIKAKALVGRLLRLTKESYVHHAPSDLEEWMSAALAILRSSLPPGIRIHVQSTPCPPVSFDSETMRQVIQALIQNAVEAISPNTGTIFVSMCLADLSAAETPRSLKNSKTHHIVLNVSDTGTGIDSDIMERIFEPFFTTKERPIHSGLGLAVARGIITSHHGLIHAASVSGRGATMSVYLPIHTSVSNRE